MIFDVTRDAQGIEQACYELLEEAFARALTRLSMIGADERTRARLEESLPKRSLSAGYYATAEYLFELKRLKDLGVLAGGYTSWEALGLARLEAAHGKFLSAHPKCSACGTLQQSVGAPKCRGCGAEFRRAR